jgi:carbamoyl-phosphate synthase small subunit
MRKKAILELENGTVFHGYNFGYDRSIAGEVVFNTAMTGYPESLTDPSYKGQLLVATYPLIGNYGVPGTLKKNDLFEYYESSKIQINGFVISDYSDTYSHWNAENSLSEWMREQKIPGIAGVDTRALTKILREHGSMLGRIIVAGGSIDFTDPNQENLVDQVSVKEIQQYGNGKYRIVLVDCGVKNNIIRELLKRDATVIRVPWDYDYSQLDFDGLFISNGPGDPVQCVPAIQNLKKAFQTDTPIFGICLGNQLMALAAGAATYKLRYGHRGHNQPVLKVGTDAAYITSQNHGFAVDNETLSPEWKPLFVNLNDDTNEGMIHESKPFFSTQFHPEASGGPTDTSFLFDDFMDHVRRFRNNA